MIEQKLLAIQQSLKNYSVYLSMFLNLDTPISKLKISNQISETDTFYRENKSVISIDKALDKLEELKTSLDREYYLEPISGSITRLKEFPNPIPANIVVRWNDISKVFDYVSQTSLGLSIGTSVFELEYFPAGSDNSILVSDNTSLYLENTNTLLRSYKVIQTNGTINLDTCFRYTTFYLDGAGVIFSGSLNTSFNHRVITTGATTEIHFDGELSVIRHNREDVGKVFYELSYTPNYLNSDYDFEQIDFPVFVGF